MKVSDIIENYQFYQNKMVHQPEKYIDEFKEFLDKDVAFLNKSQTKDISYE